MKRFITTCLEFCNRNSLKQLAIPALGTGGLQYPLLDVVETIGEAVADFVTLTRSSCTITDVFFIICAIDDESIKVRLP